MLNNNGFCNFGVSTSGPTWGMNSIFGSTVYNAAVGYSRGSAPCTLYAECDWWGNNPPNSSLFYVNPTSHGYFIYPLGSDPWAGKPFPVQSTPISGIKEGEDLTSISPNNGRSSILSTEGAYTAGLSTTIDSLLIGVGMLQQGNRNGAANFFKSYLIKHPDNQAAYVELYACADSETAPSIVQFFKSLPAQAAKEQELLLPFLYLKQGDITSAKQVNTSLATNNSNTSLGTRATINNFYIALFNDNDPIGASTLLRDVVSNAALLTPKEIANAQHALATYVGPNSGTKSSNVPAQTKKESVQNVPTQTGLTGNYPNPCNPSTTIPYNLAASGRVTLTVYDVLGREVKTLVNEIQAAGYHTVVFDASNLSSGLYFYRFTTIGMTQVKKLVVTK
jgi:hypothetical protein